MISIRSLDPDANISHFKALYTQNLKALIGKNGSIKDTVTDSARSLLILFLLEQQKQEFSLSQKILKYTVRMASIEDTKKKAEQVFNSSCTYDELCWLNAEMDFLIKKEYLKKELFISDFYK